MKICDNTRLPSCCWSCQPKLQTEGLFIEELQGLQNIQQRNKALRNTQKNRHKDECKTTERTRVSLTSRNKKDIKNTHRSVQSSLRHKIVQDQKSNIKSHINEFHQTHPLRVTEFNQRQHQYQTRTVGVHQQPGPQQWEIRELKNPESKILAEDSHLQNKSATEKQQLYRKYKIQRQFHKSYPQTQNLAIFSPYTHQFGLNMINQDKIVGAEKHLKVGYKTQSIAENSQVNVPKHTLTKLIVQSGVQKRPNCLIVPQPSLRRSLRRQTVSSFTSEQQHSLKIEESQVLIDFFNPPQIRLESLQNNLQEVPY